MKKKRRRKRREVSVEASYVCDNCGEEIVIPVDRWAGESQGFAEYCPVSCHSQMMRVAVEEDGEARAWSEGEAN